MNDTKIPRNLRIWRMKMYIQDRWFQKHAEKFGTVPDSPDETARHWGYAGNPGLPLKAILDLPTPPTNGELEAVLNRCRDKSMTNNQKRREAALTPADPSPEEQAQMDALLAKFPNLIQRRQSAPTLFNY
jgi:hypothetical protein